MRQKESHFEMPSRKGPFSKCAKKVLFRTAPKRSFFEMRQKGSLYRNALKKGSLFEMCPPPPPKKGFVSGLRRGRAVAGVVVRLGPDLRGRPFRILPLLLRPEVDPAERHVQGDVSSFSAEEIKNSKKSTVFSDFLLPGGSSIILSYI